MIQFYFGSKQGYPKFPSRFTRAIRIMEITDLPLGTFLFESLDEVLLRLLLGGPYASNRHDGLAPELAVKAGVHFELV